MDQQSPLPLGEPRDETYPFTDTRCSACYRERSLVTSGRQPGAEVYCSGCLTRFVVEQQLFGLVLRRVFASDPGPRRCDACGAVHGGVAATCSTCSAIEQREAGAA